MKNIKKQIPNALTIIRLICFLLILLFLVVDYYIDANLQNTFWWIAFATFAIAVFTDWLDGFLARKWKVESDFGRLMDPIADKLIVNSIFVIFAVYAIHSTANVANGFINYLPWYFVVIMIARDIVVDGFRMFYLSKSSSNVVPASILGKSKTVAQFVLISAFFILYALDRNSDAIAITLWVVAFLVSSISVFSGFDYVYKMATKNPKKQKTEKK